MENKIRIERVIKKMSQEDLAKQLEVHPNTVAKWERDMTHCPLDKALRLTEIFDCSLDYLIGRSETRC